jgi:hypothetical protein
MIMPAKTRSAKGQKAKSAKGKKAPSPKPSRAKKEAAPGKTLPVEALKKTISYFYLLSYCPPGRIADLRQITAPMRAGLAESAGMSEAAYFKTAIPDVCARIVAFHEDTRQPSPHWVDALAKAAGEAEKGPEKALAFQQEMANVARLPQRAKPDNRLHRKKGCLYCRLPCHYGYFTLVSSPDLRQLQGMLEAEARYPEAERLVIRPLWGFAATHLGQVAESQESIIHTEHLANLAFCLLLLGMAKSRLALPAEQLQAFQAANQAFIRGG